MYLQKLKIFARLRAAFFLLFSVENTHSNVGSKALFLALACSVNSDADEDGKSLHNASACVHDGFPTREHTDVAFDCME